MAELFFPQLSSGATAQYPIRKTRIGRTLRNVLPDGTLILAPDPDAARIIWQLEYRELSSQEIGALAAHFQACQGRLHAFTFIDPTDNLLASSANLLQSPWEPASTIELAGNAADPFGGTAAFTVTNQGQVSAELSQSLSTSAAYQYCFSVYAASAQAATLELIRRGPTAQDSKSLAIGPGWSRLVSTGRLSDSSAQFTVAVSLLPGQQVLLYGPQLEAQISQSRYRPTLGFGGVYSNAHWAVDELPISADAPNLFSTAFSIETAINH